MACTGIPYCHEMILLAIGLSNGAIIALNALGFTLIYAAIRTINLAYGDVFALASVAAASALRAYGAEGSGVLATIGAIGLALGLAMLFGGTLNIAVERLAFRPFRGRTRLAPLIASVGLSFVLYQVAFFWRAPPTVPRLLPAIPLVSSPQRPEIAYQLKDLLVLLIAAGLALLVGRLLYGTRAGRALRAVAQDAEMAELCGVHHNRTIRLVFALGGALAGAAACIYTLYYNRPFGQYGLTSGLVALTAAVLGGIGNPRGTFVAGLALGTLTALGERFLSEQWAQALVLCVLVLVLALRPAGFAGEQGGADSGADTLLAAARPTRSRRWPALIGLALALAYPALDQLLGLGRVTSATGLMIFVLLAVGLNILLGFAGLLNLGYAGSFAVGAYVAALLITPRGMVVDYLPRVYDFGAVLVCGGAAAALFGALLAVLTGRMAGDYLAIVTLASSQIIQRTVRSLELTGYSRGISARAPLRVLDHLVRLPAEWYYLALALVLLALGFSWRLLGSRIGRAWRALSDDAAAAASCGIDASAYRRLAFVLGSGLAGVAGALYTSVVGYVDPERVDVQISVLILAMIVIGGAGGVWGALVGALVVGGIDQIGIPVIGAWMARTADIYHLPWLAALDIRGLNFLSFGLVLYAAVLARGRLARSK